MKKLKQLFHSFVNWVNSMGPAPIRENEFDSEWPAMYDEKPIFNQLRDWIDINQGDFTLTQIVLYALRMDIMKMERHQITRISQILRDLGCSVSLQRIENRSIRIWTVPDRSIIQNWRNAPKAG